MDAIKKILNDIKTELTDEFDRNFEREAFFSKPWNPKAPNGLKLSGNLRNSIQSEVKGNSVVFTSQLPYAAIHNEGGEITVTAKMKKFFWAKYYNAYGGITYSIKTKEANNTKRNKMLTEEAEYWKAMALMKIGTKITIPERRFIGDHPQVQIMIKQVVDDNMKALEQYLNNTLKQK